MSPPLQSLLIFLGIFLLLVLITEFTYRFFKLPAEQSRKMIHVSGGIMCLFFPSFFDSHWWLLVLGILSFLLLFITYRIKLLDSIHKTKRRSVGSVIFPIPVYGCFLMAELLHNNLYFYLPVSLLTFSDTAAEMAGNRWGYRGKQFFNGQKTLAGSVAFFITSILACGLWFYFSGEIDILIVLIFSLLLSVAATVTELITLHGWDNLTVPAVISIVLWAFLR